MLNHITLMGRLTKNPELRRTNGGIAVTSFSIACERDFSDKQSGQKETDFIDITAWRHTAEFVDKHFSKGRMIVVSGRLQIRDWTDKDGNKRKSAEIVAENVYFGDSKPTAAPGVIEGGSAFPEAEAVIKELGLGNTGDFQMLPETDDPLPF